MTSLKLIVKSLFKRKIANLLIIIQLSITIILLINTIIQVKANSYQQNQIKKHLNLDIDRTIHLQISNTNQSEEFIGNYTRFGDYINRLPHVKGFGGYDIINTYFNELKEDNEFIAVRNRLIKGTFKAQWPSAIEIVKVDKGMYNMSNVKITKGTNFSRSNFNKNGEVFSMLAGWDYINVLHINQILTDNMTGTKYKIIGFMDKNSRWFSEQSYIGDMLINLDDKFICPFSEVDKTNINSIRAKAAVLFYEVDNIKNLNETSVLITNKASILNLKISNSSIRNDLKEYNSNFKDIFYLNLILALFIGVMSILGIAITTLSSIITRKKEIGIRIMTGASIFNIIALVIGEIFMLIFISSIISISSIIYNKIKFIKASKFNDILLNPMDNVTPKIILFSILIIMILTIIISIIPIIQIKKLQPKDLIGGKD